MFAIAIKVVALYYQGTFLHLIKITPTKSVCLYHDVQKITPKNKIASFYYQRLFFGKEWLRLL
jgi:hypothetical protein